MNIDQLNLAPAALAVARRIATEFPGAIVFTSGRRDVTAQAAAMVGNVLKNRRWIAQTYVSTPESRLLQTYVDTHPAYGHDQLVAGFVAIMAAWTEAQRRALSYHFSGEAFDIEPMTGPQGEKVEAFIRSIVQLPAKFLTQEGGLPRWHIQVPDAPPAAA